MASVSSVVFAVIENGYARFHGLKELVGRQICVSGNIVMDQNWSNVDGTLVHAYADFSVPARLWRWIEHPDSARTYDCRWRGAELAYVATAIEVDWRSN